ncbi:MAG TPA: hypothetical protein VHS59_11690 [Bacillota bacterium]|nr:hypothetical protein [Bacillota bacterium]
MSEGHQIETPLEENSEVAFNYIRDRLVEVTNIFNGLASSYTNMASAANQLITNTFAHRRQVDDAIDRVVEVGHILDKLIKQIDVLVAEYQPLSVVDQIALGHQLVKGK